MRSPVFLSIAAKAARRSGDSLSAWQDRSPKPPVLGAGRRKTVEGETRRGLRLRTDRVTGEIHTFTAEDAERIRGAEAATDVVLSAEVPLRADLRARESRGDPLLEAGISRTGSPIQDSSRVAEVEERAVERSRRTPALARRPGSRRPPAACG